MLVSGVVPHVCGVCSQQVYEAMALMPTWAQTGHCGMWEAWNGQAMPCIICMGQCRSAGHGSAVAVHCRGGWLLRGE